MEMMFDLDVQVETAVTEATLRNSAPVTVTSFALACQEP
ncbi:hypothetical protein EV586_104118 [Tumebacillus sp. BK434]|nr:FDLD family class I lanthipeptide [Tumebacillus sp. BK434]TCP54500.1 hypothetical protein EV586_104118 [Tumebacillus sp. BK434]